MRGRVRGLPPDETPHAVHGGRGQPVRGHQGGLGAPLDRREQQNDLAFVVRREAGPVAWLALRARRDEPEGDAPFGVGHDTVSAEARQDEGQGDPPGQGQRLLVGGRALAAVPAGGELGQIGEAGGELVEGEGGHEREGSRRTRRRRTRVRLSSSGGRGKKRLLFLRNRGGRLRSPMSQARNDRRLAAKQTSSATVAGSLIRGLEVRRSSSELQINISPDLALKAEPKFIMPADAALARIRLGSPELHFAQVDPYEPSRLPRLAILRFAPERFVSIFENHQSMIVEAKKNFGGKPPENKEISTVFQGVKSAASTAMIDADVIITSMTGHQASMVFFSISQGVKRDLTMGANSIDLTAEIEITMPSMVFFDLLSSWQSTAEKMRELWPSLDSPKSPA